jgi:hypothetical protein
MSGGFLMYWNFYCDWINKFCVLASTQFFRSAVLSSVNCRCDHFLCKAEFYFSLGQTV